MSQVQVTPKSNSEIQFSPGDIVVHKQNKFRGVVLEVDEQFFGTDELLNNHGSYKGAKKRPWYHVLVDGTQDVIYVAECHLTGDNSGAPVNHPMINSVFTDFANGRYIRLTH